MNEMEKRLEAARRFLYAMQIAMALRDSLDDLLGNLTTGFEYWIKAEHIIGGKVVITEAMVREYLDSLDATDPESSWIDFMETNGR
jgi:hypothetical protein